MPQIIVIKPFAFAHGGHRIERFEPSDEPRETSERCAQVAVREGWARMAGAPEMVTHATAPENRDAARKPRARKQTKFGE